MKNRIIDLLLFLAIVLIISNCKSDQAEEKIAASILPGWEGNADYFRMEKDIIIAGHLDKAIPNNEFLCTEKTYKDFEIRLQAKLIGEGKNAGIQFRSARIPDHFEVIGYQCDMGESADRLIWGSLYDESRRKDFLAHPPAEAVKEVFKPGDWNEFIIRAEGPRIQIWLNGFLTVDYVEQEEGIAEEGIICVQIHSGLPAEASYKDIEIKEL